MKQDDKDLINSQTKSSISLENGNQWILEVIDFYLAKSMTTLSILPQNTISKVVSVLDDARVKGRTVVIFGNGGSAATASHIACDLAKGANCSNRPRFRVLALTDNLPVFSAWANDTSYDCVFSEQLENYLESEDVVIAISGSGDSSNILKAVEVANIKGAITIGFIGLGGGKLKDLVDIPLIIPNDIIEQVEDIHLLLGHLITTCLRYVK